MHIYRIWYVVSPMQCKGAGCRPKLHAQCRLDRPISRNIYIYIYVYIYIYREREGESDTVRYRYMILAHRGCSKELVASQNHTCDVEWDRSIDRYIYIYIYIYSERGRDSYIYNIVCGLTEAV